ncbi:MAG: AIR synthase related protein [Acidimicrobiia bacterium]
MTDQYRQAGVDYDVLDPAKRNALNAAASTSALLGAHGGRAVDASRGEPAFVFELGTQQFAVVLECLGTKSVLAREVQAATGRQRFDAVAYDAVAAILNDLACVGAAPLVVNAYFSTGSAAFYADTERFQSLVEGWRAACADGGAVWGGGESPTLSGLVAPDDIELAGSAVGVIEHGAAITGDALATGDDIVFIAATGLHANGASLARQVAGALPNGYATELPDGRQFGDALLDPAPLYSPIVTAALAAGATISYCSHVTGHGFRKLMRAERELRYVITEVPPVPPVLEFLVAQLGMDGRDAYGTFNMGAGFAIYCPTDSTEPVLDAAKTAGLDAWRAGHVETGERSIVVEPLGVEWRSDDYSAR